MSILSFLRSHTHYWGIPYPRATDNRLVQTCYECGAEREVKIELRSTSSGEIESRPAAEGDIKVA